MISRALKHFFDLVIFTWIWSLSKKAREGSLNIQDLPVPPEGVYASSAKNAVALGKNTPWGLLRSLVRHHKLLAFISISGMLLRLGTSFSIPIVLGLFIKQMEINSNQAVFWGSALVIVCAAQALIVSFYFSRSDRLAIQIQNSICTQLFASFFSINREERNKIGKGMLLNIAGEDAETFGRISSVLIEFAHDILTICIGVILLYFYLGMATFTVIIPLLILASLVKSRSTAFGNAENTFLMAKDNRVGIISRFFEGIRQIKLSGLEKFVNQNIEQSRKKEVFLFGKYIRADIVTTFIYGSVITLLPLLSFGVYGFFQNPFEANIIFPSLLVIAMLEDPFNDASAYIGELAKVKVIGKRFLEIFSLKCSTSHLLFSTDKASIIVENLSIDSETQAAKAVLDSVSFEINRGESVAFVGPIGSGKTCLLNAIMGETSAKKGTIQIPEGSSLGWVPQHPILFQDTIRSNICMGISKTIDASLLQACSLDKELSALPYQLETYLGNRGVTLSGGQIQRVSLARVAYSDPDIILLDDPLSAVDFKTEDVLIQKLIFGLWHEKTLLMATHRMRYLDKFDKVIFLENGKIEAIGTYHELLRSSKRFAQFIQHENKRNNIPVMSNPQNEDSPLDGEEENESLNEVAAENRESGKVKWAIWKSYLKEFSSLKEGSFSLFFLITFGILALFTGMLPLAQDAWLSIWTANYQSSSNHYIFYLGIYSLLGFLSFFASLSYLWISSRQGLEVSNRLHHAVLEKLIQAKPRFFNVFPIGRIVQRLSRDISTLDRLFPKTLREFLNVVIKISLTLIVIAATIWQTLFIIPLLIFAALKVGKTRNILFRELKRLDAIARSPFYHILDECLSDMSLIKVMNKGAFYKKRLFDSFDHIQKVVYAESGLCWGFYFFSQLLISLLITSIVVGALFFSNSNVFLASITGLILKFTLDVSRQVRRAIEGWGNVESQITALERLNELKSVPAEPDNQFPIPQFWPSKGAIEISHLSARYDSGLPPVLKFINLNIEPGTKVGIVGQTGAGKSSLCQLLLGVLEITEGHAKIDGVDITTLSPPAIRSRIGVIPQIPFLIPGNLRQQVDPNEDFNDSEVGVALEKVGLPHSQFDNGLDTSVEDLSSSLSMGQKQLISFARVLLMNPSLLILDEATASIDVETDHKIQNLLRHEFKNKTIISVAHRLESVADYDYILELSQGKIKKIEHKNVIQLTK